MFCTNCGTQLPEGAKFCTNCGNQMNVAPAMPVMPAAPVIPEEPVVPEPVIVPEQSIVVPEQTVSIPEQTIVVPEQTVSIPEQTVVVPEQNVSVPEQTVVVPEQTVSIPEQTVVVPEQNVSIPEQTVVASEPVAPVMPELPPQPTFVPEQSMTQPAMQPTIQPQPSFAMPPAPEKKKSKAPLFIGFGIGAVAIVVIIVVLILLLLDGDNKKNNNETTTPTTTVSDEYSTEESTSSDDSMTDEDFLDAVNNMAEDIMVDIEDESTDALDDYLMPSVVDYLSAKDKTSKYLLDNIYLCLIDAEGTLLEYEISDAKLTDSTYFEDEDIESALDKFVSYVKPTSFAQVTVTVTYDEQTSDFYLHFALCDDNAYLYDFNTDDFFLDFEDESLTIEVSDEIKTMLDENYVTMSAGTYEGTFYGSNYTVGLPTDWTGDSESYGMPYIIAPSSTTYYSIVTDSTYSLVTPAEFVQAVYNLHVQSGYTNIEVGNLTTTNLSGYYISYTQMVEDTTWYTVQCLFEAPDGSCLCVSIFTTDPYSTEFQDAQASVASLKFN